MIDSNIFLKSIPTHPGVYQMLNDKGKIIYVGKAKNLKKRLTSYFKTALDTKTQVMIAQVCDIQTIVTNSENEALLLEANLIKELKPRYNVLLRDDKSYPYLYLSLRQDFPRLDFHRGSMKKPGRYFGPYPSAGSVRDNLALVQKLFKLRQCNDSFFSNRTRPCLQYQIKRCTAPCVEKVSKKKYQEQVQDAVLFLEGKNNEVVDRLTEKMSQTAKNKDYEQAAIYRDQIIQLRKLQQQQSIIGKKGDIDVLGAASLYGQAVVSILIIRSGRVLGSRNYFPKLELEQTNADVLSAFISQYYLNPVRHDDIPEKVIVTEKLEDKSWLQDALSKKLAMSFIIADQKTAANRAWRHIVLTNAEQHLTQQVASKQHVTDQFNALQAVLNLNEPIERMECFDISHTQGEATVASCVVFDQNGPHRQAYRRFNIKNITAGDDYAAMHQALTRRYKKLKESGAAFPDLLVIDGGKGQLHEAVKVLEELQVSGVLLIGVAKGPGRKAGLEQLWMPNKKEPIILPDDSLALHLIQHIRDESHRFAITAHRKQRDKRRIESPLQAIPGVGPKRRQALLNYFGGLQELKKASAADIMKVPGVSSELAQLIYNALR